MRKSALIAALVAAVLVVPLGVYASHQFSDVPDSHLFHNAIGWMKDNNVTSGCNPPVNDKYCPDDTVTRGQMAAFMKRLSEGQVVDAATAIDSDMVDGRAVGCLAGEIEYAGECWESAARADIGNVFDAADQCGTEGGRLPYVLELRRFGQIGAVAAPDLEYTSTVYYDGAFRTFRLDGPGMVDSSTIAGLSPYRCVFPLFEGAATPAGITTSGDVGEDGS
jgi:hypothetical protein